jgi:hypothetical protein
MSRASAKIVDINAMLEAKKFQPQPWVVMSSRAHECEYIITVHKILNLKHKLALFAQPFILNYLFEGQSNEHGPKN